MSLQRIVIDSPLSAAGFASVCNFAPGGFPALQSLENYLGALSGGNQMASLSVKVGCVQAVGLVTFTGAPTAAETCVIGNVTFTARASGATGNEFNIGGSVTITATNLAAAINASANLTGKITATSALGVVTLTSVVPGLIGNALQLSEALSNTTITAFAGGTDGTSYSLSYGV